jgi:hypothetical protein
MVHPPGAIEHYQRSHESAPLCALELLAGRTVSNRVAGEDGCAVPDRFKVGVHARIDSKTMHHHGPCDGIDANAEIAQLLRIQPKVRNAHSSQMAQYDID